MLKNALLMIAATKLGLREDAFHWLEMYLWLVLK
jgi:hypothetical protein